VTAISVITPTHNNWGELQYCIDAIEAQTFDNWQHVVVHDGPNPKLREKMYHRGYAAFGKQMFIELGRNWHGFMGGDSVRTLPGHPGGRGGRGSRSSCVVLAASYLAAGKYIGYCDADCDFRPDHLKVSHAVLEETDADFTYTQTQRYLDGRLWDVIGDGILGHGRIDGNSVVHKAELFKTVNWRWGGDSDWDLISRFRLAGANYAFIPEITVNWRHASNDV
jgi:glycosyltransferase involved in cell wall biosynthesis